MKVKRKAGVGLLLLLLLASNWMAGFWHSRIDLTSEKRYSISSATQKILSGLNDKVSIDVFLQGNYPSSFKKLRNSTADLLNEFRREAGNTIQFRFIAPDETVTENKTWGDSLSAMGILPINLTSQLKEGQQQQMVYPVALVHCNTQTIPVTLYNGKTPFIGFQELNNAEAMLEFHFADAIHKLTRSHKPLIGFATGNGEPMDIQVYDMVENILKPNYNLRTFNLAQNNFIPDTLKALIIIKPGTPFSEIEKLKLDQYVMKGGNLFILIDRLQAEMDSLQLRNEVIAYDRNLQLTDLFFKWGARVNADLVMDLQCDYLPFDVSGNGQFELLPWNYFPVAQPASSHIIVKNLGFVASRFVNSIDTVEADNIRKTVLLSSSENARLVSTPALISGSENVNAPQHEKFKDKYIPFAVLLEGKFNSLYANRLTNAMADSLKAASQSYCRSGSGNAKIIIVSDGDVALNSIYKGSPIPMGINPFTFGTQREFPFANRDFFINSMDYLTDESGLAEAKGKDYTVRLLNIKKVNAERAKWQLINIAVPVLLVVLFGFLFRLFRIKKYAVKK